MWLLTDNMAADPPRMARGGVADGLRGGPAQRVHDELELGVVDIGYRYETPAWGAEGREFCVYV